MVLETGSVPERLSKISRRALARRVNYHWTWVNRVLRGECLPGRELARSIAVVIGVSTDELLDHLEEIHEQRRS